MALVALITAGVLAVLLVARELTWRRAFAKQRERIAADRIHIREQEQLVQVGQLVSGLAQELKSPLQGAIGNTELMLASVGPESKDELLELQENVARAAGIVRNLLAFTETSALSRRWQDINELASRAVGAVQNELDACGVRVNFALADRLPLMYVDGRQLEKVIATLLSRPEPRSTPRHDTAALVTLATRRSDVDDRLIIELDDRTAVTIDEADEPTWSGDLVACRQIVQAHGGSLEVEHPANGGYRFHLELPVTAAGADHPNAAAS